MTNYATSEQVDIFAQQSGDPRWGARNPETKLFAIYLASNDIESWMGVPREMPTERPFIGEWALNDACAYRATYISRNLEARLTADRVREYTAGNYSSSGFSVSARSEAGLDNMTTNLMRQFLKSMGRPRAMEFVRG